MIEQAFLNLGKAILNAAIASALKRRSENYMRRASLAESLQKNWPDLLLRRRAERNLGEVVDEILQRLIHLRQVEFNNVSENELAAATLAAQATFESADLSDDVLFMANMNGRQLASQIKRTLDVEKIKSTLSPQGADFYELVVDEGFLVIAQIVIHLPQFGSRGIVELLSRQADIADQLRDLVRQLPAVSLDAPEGEQFDSDFLYRYQESMSETFDRVEIFGIPGNSRVRVPLTLAYLNLQAEKTLSSRNNFFYGKGGVRQAPPSSRYKELGRISEEISQSNRLLIRGEAGCGKTTLLKWIAVNAARGSFDEELQHWNSLSPFLIKLRSFADKQRLPRPSEFLHSLPNPLLDLMPPAWVHRRLKSGKSIVMIDGLDEIPQDRCGEVKDWLNEILREYPNIAIIVTSRPTAVSNDWLDSEDFDSLVIRPMDKVDVRRFVRYWHDALRSSKPKIAAVSEIDEFESKLIAHFEFRQDLRRIAANPLLCSMVCALNFENKAHIPYDRKRLYEIAMDILLEFRDARRSIETDSVKISFEAKLTLLRDLAWRLTLNNMSEIDKSDAVEYVTGTLKAMPQGVNLAGLEVLNHLLARSGVIREPQIGVVDFIHRTFQEYLTARQAVDQDMIGLLISHAHEVAWREVILMTPAFANAKQRERLLGGILNRADVEELNSAPLRLLAAICAESSSSLEETTQNRANQALKTLVPPRTEDDARLLATVGDRVLQHLPSDPSFLDDDVVGLVTYTICLVGGTAAVGKLAAYARDGRDEVLLRLIAMWGCFDTDDYVDSVLAAADLSGYELTVDTTAQFCAASRIPTLNRLVVNYVRNVYCSMLEGSRNLRSLRVMRCIFFDGRGITSLPSLRHLSFSCSEFDNFDLSEIGNLESLDISTTSRVEDLDFVRSGTNLRKFRIGRLRLVQDFSPLTELVNLENLGLMDARQFPSNDIWQSLTMLNSLELVNCKLSRGLDSLEAIADRVSTLKIRRCGSVASLDGLEKFSLTRLSLSGLSIASVEGLITQDRLKRLTLRDLDLIEDISQLSQISTLEFLEISRCNEIRDFSSLANIPNLRILVLGGHKLQLQSIPESFMRKMQESEISFVINTIHGVAPRVSAQLALW